MKPLLRTQLWVQGTEQENKARGSICVYICQALYQASIVLLLPLDKVLLSFRPPEVLRQPKFTMPVLGFHLQHLHWYYCDEYIINCLQSVVVIDSLHPTSTSLLLSVSEQKLISMLRPFENPTLQRKRYFPKSWEYLSMIITQSNNNMYYYTINTLHIYTRMCLCHLSFIYALFYTHMYVYVIYLYLYIRFPLKKLISIPS